MQAGVAEQVHDTPHKSVARSAGIVSLAVMASRLLGLVREQVFAALFGAGFISDAFQVGFRIPNTLRDLFAEGALSAAFVKTFTDYIVKKKDQAAAWRVASLVMNAFLLILVGVTLLGIIFAPQIVHLIAHDFPPEKARLATLLMRVMFPFILMVSLAALAMGVLNTKGRFGVPASASTMFNIGSILGGLALAYVLSGGGWSSPADPNTAPGIAARWAIIGMALGTLIGGSLQFIIQIPSLLKVGFRFRREVSFSDPGVKKVMRLMAPALIGAAAVQVNVFVDTYFASGIPGAASWLAYSFRLMQFPIGLFGVAIGTATLPAISLHAAKGDTAAFRSTLASSISLVLFLAIPSAVGLIVLARPIVMLIYQHGVFRPEDTTAVAWALTGWSLGLVGYAAIKVLSPAFYALDDARTPMFISLGSIFINAIGDYFLKRWLSPFGLGHVGLALATSIVAILNFGALLWLMRRRIGTINGRAITLTLTKVLAASLALGLASFATYHYLRMVVDDVSLIARMMLAFLPIAVGMAVYAITSRLLHVTEMKQLTGIIAARLRRQAAAAD